MVKKTLRNVRDYFAVRLMGPVLEEAFRKNARDIREWRQQHALMEAGEFVEEHMPFVQAYTHHYPLITHALSQRATFDDGLICEFGVATGKTVNFIANLLPQLTVHGFDSFEGLPEDWRDGYPKGTFKREALPQVRSNVELHRGWFRDTLPGFLREHPGRASFLHIDCDLYSSTADIFGLMESRIAPGTVMVFDEYFNFPGWRVSEYKAFMEFIKKTGYGFEYLGYCVAGEQVAVKITHANGNGAHR